MDEKRLLTELGNFFLAGTRQVFKKKQMIMRLQHDCRDVFWVNSGFVRVSGYTPSGSDITAHMYKHQEMFPIAGLLSDHIPPAFYNAYTDVVLYRRDRDDLLEFIDGHPRVGLLLLKQVSQIFDPLFYLHTETAEQRVVLHLAHLARRFGSLEDGQVRIDLPFTQQDFADSVNLSRETVGKLLLRLENDGYIIRSRHSTLLDATKFEELKQQMV